MYNTKILVSVTQLKSWWLNFTQKERKMNKFVKQIQEYHGIKELMIIKQPGEGNSLSV